LFLTWDKSAASDGGAQTYRYPLPTRRRKDTAKMKMAMKEKDLVFLQHSKKEKCKGNSQ
jgi:hypothetical protein